MFLLMVSLPSSTTGKPNKKVKMQMDDQMTQEIKATNL